MPCPGQHTTFLFHDYTLTHDDDIRVWQGLFRSIFIVLRFEKYPRHATRRGQHDLRL